MDKMCLDALSIYIDYINDFVEEIEDKLGSQTWIKVRNAIHIITVEEFELLMKMKEMSNAKFYKGEPLKLKEAKNQLETSPPNDLQVFKELLRKLLHVHEIWGLLS
ncbi:hypothetical protein GLOIN_2v1472566 [Rhizophagus clarus]|uniref:Uncharacterized protein n=1 Tax=Rhizophagus clarus TaxID=94130 RepID=A0A8H3LQG9_9GLOM|nr:hypothetical protein GLOIN_2v1472566 [Rhizophagus clarus]